MYDKYILSLKQLKQIEEFSKKNKPLLIYGKTGCGKTSLAKDILKEISDDYRLSLIGFGENAKILAEFKSLSQVKVP